MAEYKGKQGRWVTTKTGKHIFIEEDNVDRQERQIKERAEQTKLFTAVQNSNSTPVDYSKVGSRQAAVTQFEQDTGIKVTFDPNDDNICTKTNLYMILNTVAEMKQKYPQQLRFLKQIGSYHQQPSIFGGMSLACANNNDVLINDVAFSMHHPKLDAMYKMGTQGSNPYHPKNTTARDILTHELGHVMFEEHMGRMNRRLTKHDLADQLNLMMWARSKTPISMGTTAKYIQAEIDKALTTALGTTPTHYALGYANPKFKHATAISGYASSMPHELMAEAVADFMANGNNASPFSKELVKILGM